MLETGSVSFEEESVLKAPDESSGSRIDTEHITRTSNPETPSFYSHRFYQEWRHSPEQFTPDLRLQTPCLLPPDSQPNTSSRVALHSPRSRVTMMTSSTGRCIHGNLASMDPIISLLPIQLHLGLAMTMQSTNTPRVRTGQHIDLPCQRRKRKRKRKLVSQ